MFLNKPVVFWILTIAVINVLIISQLVQDGMFMDGMLYTAVSKNLSEGLGTFWNPHFSKTSMSSFHEQPPLYFGLLAVFYKVFGTSMYVERLFVFVFYTLTLVYICKLWKKLFITNAKIAKNTWLPVLFYSVIPVCFWAYTNHVEEVVMCAFALMAIYYTYIALFLNEKIILNLVLSGCFIFLASLTKGVQGLFPIACVAFYWLTTKNVSLKKTITYSFILAGVPALIYSSLIFCNHNVYLSFEQYFTNRFVKTFNNFYATTNNRFEIIIRLITELLPILSVSILIKLISKKNMPQNQQVVESKRKLWWLLAIGLSGSLPLAITTEQRGFYLVTALPYFALAISAWLAPTLTYLLDKINLQKTAFKFFSYSVALFLFISVGYTVLQIGNFNRDKDLLTDIYAIGKVVPKGEMINVPKQTWDEWDIQGYFIRYFYISLDVTQNKHPYFMMQKNLPDSLVPNGYKLYPLKNTLLDLYTLSSKKEKIIK
ncbi:MAG TPA: glycosyltransferase family 39 protein [Bacteroidia bacterium]|nr:glycosyltransferase family 39 protein [Bacteroidia bacterium]